MKKILATAVALALVALRTTSVFADTISIGASKDTTIFRNNVNNVNNSGGGNGLFADTNGASSPRRALIAFDIAGSIPAGVLIQSVQLTLTLGQVAGAAVARVASAVCRLSICSPSLPIGAKARFKAPTPRPTLSAAKY